MPLKVSRMQGGSPHTSSESISDSFSSRIISGSGVWGCASAMSQRQLCPRTATAKSCVKSLLSGLCPTWDEQTGKSCAAVASSSQQPSNRAVCKVDTYTSRHRVLANPITNPTVISIISILFCLFFFFFQMCTNHLRKSLSRFHRPVHLLSHWFAATGVLRALCQKVFFRRDECTCRISINERLC